MRTIASTFGTSEEAETAIRRLQGIGIPAEAIVARDLSDPEAGETGTVSDGATGIFISVKVSAEQVGAATEILKESRHRAAAPAAAEGPEAPTEERVMESGGSAARHAPPPSASPAADRPGTPLGREHPRAAPHQIPAADGEWRRWSRRMVIFCLVLVVAFITGALLGLVI